MVTSYKIDIKVWWKGKDFSLNFQNFQEKLFVEEEFHTSKTLIKFTSQNSL